MNLNKVILIGRIASDLNVSISKTGVSFLRFTLAVTRDTIDKSNEITDFIPCAAFRNNAAFLSKYFNKGDLINVVGSIQTSQYTTKNGDVVTSSTVVIDQVKALERKSVTQSRAERQNTSLGNIGNQQEILGEPTFHNNGENKEIDNNDKKDDEDNPWELDF